MSRSSVGSWLISALLAAWAPAVAVSGSVTGLSLLDDRGRPLDAPVQVCFVRELETECTDVGRQGVSGIALRPFELLRVEGPEHGPVTVRRAELGVNDNGGFRLAVPRKARLAIAGLPEETVVLSLYAVDDPEARQPRFRYELEGEGELRVPAGGHLASLSRRGFAPDLHALSALPGGDLRIRYRESDGWSLALRLVSPEDDSPVPGASVEVVPTSDFDDHVREPVRRRTDALGFALFSGLTEHLVRAVVRHPDLAETEVQGLFATPGTFDLRHVTAERGGTVEARIRVDGEAAAGAECAIVRDAGPDEAGHAVIEPVQHVEADADGACRIEHVVPGVRFLRVHPDRGSSSVVDRQVQVISEQVIPVDVDLATIQLTGTVLRGAEPAGPGYEIGINHFLPAGPGGSRDEIAHATTDDEGAFHAVLWTPGDYYLLLSGPSGVPFTSKRAYLEEPVEEVNFLLSEREIRGRVVDQDGEPVEEIPVSLTWNRSAHVGARTDAAGEFSFPLGSEEGDASLSARGAGYAPSEVVHRTVVNGAPIPPVTLTVRELERIRGRLTAGGAPVANGRVWSFRATPGGAPTTLGFDRTGPEGTFEAPPAPGAATWLYASGPGCPLEVHEVAPPIPPGQVELRCGSIPAGLRLRLLGGDGSPLDRRSLILRHEGRVIPRDVLRDHLAVLGVPAATDGRGWLVLPALAPGDYELYLGDASNEATVAQGLRHGFLAAVTLVPQRVHELEIVVDPSGP